MFEVSSFEDLTPNGEFYSEVIKQRTRSISNSPLIKIFKKDNNSGSTMNTRTSNRFHVLSCDDDDEPVSPNGISSKLKELRAKSNRKLPVRKITFI